MIAAPMPRPPVRGAHAIPPLLRRARPQDAPALHALSLAFVRSGALRRRGIDHYRAHAGEFLVAAGHGDGRGDGHDRGDGRGPAEAPVVRGCLALSDEGGGVAVLYNFCVAQGSQGQGLGAALLRAAVAEARGRSFREVFTATVGGAALFRRHGFVPVRPGRAPAAWARAMDPARGSEVLSRRL